MKKSILLMFTVMFALVIAGCGASDDEAGNNEGETEGETERETDFPKKSLELIVPFSAGGGTDSVGRAIAKSAEEHLGESIGVVNKTGGGGAVGFTEGASAKPDGYTMTMLTVEVTMLPHLGLTETTYEDFKSIAQFNFDPSSIAVPADAPYDTIEEFIEYAKENPGEIRIGNGSAGGTGHLSAAEMAKVTGTEFSHVPFDGSAPAVTSLLGGHIEAASVQPPEVLPQVEAGELKVLAIMANERLDILPDVPTFQEAGYDIGEIGVWRGVAVPKDTPDNVVSVMSEAFEKAAEGDDFKDFMENNGLGIVSRDSEGFGQLMEESSKTYGDLISELGLD